MRILITILSLSVMLSSELEVDGNLKVTGTIENDSLAQVIANLEAQILMMQSQITYLQVQLGLIDCNGVVGGDAVLDCNGICNGDSIDCPCVDNEGYVYETIQIGSQLWMAENLRTREYRNGDILDSGGSNWTDLIQGDYARYDDDDQNAEIYGMLYNWYAIDDERGICPEGWHIPSRAEMEQLIIFLGGVDIEDNPETDYNELYYENSQVSGGKAKMVGTEYWNNPNTGATNESGFSGLPGGIKNGYNGYYEDIGERALFWLSSLGTSGGNVTPMTVQLGYNHTEFWIDNGSWNAGYSVRCLAD